MDQQRQKTTFEQQYQQIMETARVGVEQPLLPVAPTEASFFFPWEYSPYRANGTTSAESD